MLIKKFKTTNCIDNCKIFNDKSEYLYWENRNETSDEVDIVNFLNRNKKSQNLNILHVGIGNSFLASNIINFKEVIGITISQNEIIKAATKNISNYKFFFLNKYQINSLKIFDNIKFDIIVDINMKSFSCCDKAFLNLFDQYVDSLKESGFVISHINGLKWSRIVKPKWVFSLKNLFHKKLKEYDGPQKNKLSLSDCKILANKKNLKLDLNHKDLIIFRNDK